MILRFRKIVLFHKIINKTRSTKNQQNSAHRFGENSLDIKRLLLFLQYNYHHHFHYHQFHYHRKMHFYRLIILLTIYLDCKMIPFLFQLNLSSFLWQIFFSSLIPSFSFVTLSKRTQNSFTTTR